MKTQNTNAKTTLIVVGLLAAATLVEVARADEAPVAAPVKTVAYKDLNLDTPAGVQVLYKRIQGAAKQVCGEIEVRDLQGVRAHKACMDRAVAGAVAAVNNEMLTHTQTVTVAQVR
jgi:UrcA family protein